MSSSLVHLAITDSVAVLTLTDPKRRNVLSPEMVAGIGDAFDRAESDPSVRCVVLTGAGNGFCAGAELDTLFRAAEGDFGPVTRVYDGFLRVLRSPLLTVAAVNGPAVGAGMNLALACDLRIAGPTAFFDTRFAQLRLHPGGGHMWLLQRAVGGISARQRLRCCRPHGGRRRLVRSGWSSTSPDRTWCNVPSLWRRVWMAWSRTSPPGWWPRSGPAP